MGRRADKYTKDLFKDFEPQEIVARFDEGAVKAFSIEARLKKALCRAIEDSPYSREEISLKISDYLGESVSKATLEAYCSQAKENRIPATRLLAIALILDDPRILNMLAREAGWVVVNKKYEALLKRESAREAIKELEIQAAAADAEWRVSR